MNKIEKNKIMKYYFAEELEKIDLNKLNIKEIKILYIIKLLISISEDFSYMTYIRNEEKITLDELKKHIKLYLLLPKGKYNGIEVIYKKEKFIFYRDDSLQDLRLEISDEILKVSERKISITSLDDFLNSNKKYNKQELENMKKILIKEFESKIKLIKKRKIEEENKSKIEYEQKELLENIIKKIKTKKKDEYYEIEGENNKITKNMIKKIFIPKQYENRFIKKDYFEFPKQRLICLYGCNGIGKSSLLDLINKSSNYKENFCEILKKEKELDIKIEYYSENIPNIVYWKAENNSGGRCKDNYLLEDNLDLFVDYIDSTGISEGQSLTNNFIKFLNNLDTTKLNILLIDELDSGLGLGSINILKGYIYEFLKKNPHIYIIMGINNYQWIYKEENKLLYRMDTGELTDIKNYEDFVKLTLEINRKLLEK